MYLTTNGELESLLFILSSCHFGFSYKGIQYLFSAPAYTIEENSGITTTVMMTRTGDTPGDTSELQSTTSVGK